METSRGQKIFFVDQCYFSVDWNTAIDINSHGIYKSGKNFFEKSNELLDIYVPSKNYVNIS